MAYSDIKDPSAYFQAVLWTGDGLDNKQITNDGNSDLQPDWVWLKDRTQAESHAIFDSTRGADSSAEPQSARHACLRYQMGDCRQSITGTHEHAL